MSQNQQQHKGKKPTDKQSSSINAKQLEQRVRKLTNRLSRQHICKEHKFIANMNLKLEIKLQQLIKFEELKNLKTEEVSRVLNNVPYLEKVQEQSSNNHLKTEDKHLENGKIPIKKQHTHSTLPNQIYKLKYPASQRTVILAGITRAWTEAAIKDFNCNSSEIHNRTSSYKKHPTTYHQLCQVVGINDFWIAVEADTIHNAQMFKKFIRLRKRSFEEKKDFSFKQEKRRVRIVMQNEDFYTLLVDAMTERKNCEFIKRLVNPSSGIFPSMCLRDNRRVLPYPNQEYQMGLKKTNKILYFPIIANRTQSKDSEQHFSLQQAYSQEMSKTSQLFESMNSMNDLIEKADQGTQAQSLGVGTNEETIGDNVRNEWRQVDQSEVTAEMVNFSGRNRKVEKSWESLDGLQRGNQIEIDDKGNETKRNQISKVKESEQSHQLEQSQIDSEHQILITPTNVQNQKHDESQNNGFSQQQSAQNNNCIEKTGNIQQTNNFTKNQELKDSLNSFKQPQKQPYKLPQPQLQPQKQQQSHQQTPQQLTPNTFPTSLKDVRQPPLPPRLLKFYFSTNTQTPISSLNYTKMKCLQVEYRKKPVSRMKMPVGIPEKFKQISDQERNRDLFFHSLFNSMERKSQKKERIV